MASNASRGAAAKGKTKKWLEARGYQVGDLEVVRWVFAAGRPRLPVKRDQFGSDLLAVSAKAILFVQVKSGGIASGGSFPDARREFEKFAFTPAARKVIIAWPLRARVPRVLEVFSDDSYLEYSAESVAGGVL